MASTHFQWAARSPARRRLARPLAAFQRSQCRYAPSRAIYPQLFALLVFYLVFFKKLKDYITEHQKDVLEKLLFLFAA